MPLKYGVLKSAPPLVKLALRIIGGGACTGAKRLIRHVNSSLSLKDRFAHDPEGTAVGHADSVDPRSRLQELEGFPIRPDVTNLPFSRGLAPPVIMNFRSFGSFRSSRPASPASFSHHLVFWII